MNPFEDKENETIKITAIKITLNKMGNKKITEIDGWLDLTKEEFTLIKKTLNTGGSMHNNIIKLQGNRIEFIKNELNKKGINEEIITIVE